ncbi:family 1 glycosylhydrolase [Cellulomonas sp. Y8]|uniref:family 1 glycosylhydrolase n=1 Tax=Cellulomonas sp. Y8 TaxID=2591145 RepID=UPI003D724D52
MTSTAPRPAESMWWGVAQAGHQNDGNNTASDTWFLEHIEPTVFREPSGDACRSWELWEEDLDLAAGMGLNAYRFSVEWARVEPQQGQVDEAALARYDALVDGCLSRGLTPLATYSHFTAPHWFARQASWLRDGAADDFAEFSGRVTERIGDRLGAVITLNEPNLPSLLAAGGLPAHMWDAMRESLAAAARLSGVDRYRASNIMVPEEFDEFAAAMTAAHRSARAAIKSVRSTLPVGLSIAIADDVALPGGEPSRDARRAATYDHWLDVARDDDFIGVQNYERTIHGPDGIVPPPAGARLNDMGSEIAPGSLAGAVRYAQQVAGVPVLVTEHGIATNDDALRCAFIPEAIVDFLDTVRAEGLDVLGYCHWTLLDNFEWIFGYDVRLGLHEVDRTTFERRPKPSADVYRQVVSQVRSSATTPATSAT